MKKAKKYLPLLLILLIIISVIFFVRRRRGQTKGEVTTPIEQTFEFLGRDSDGRPTETLLPLTFISATKQDSVTIQGKKATAKNNKVFLVLNFKVQNDNQIPFYLLPVDLIRLLQDGETKVAPSVHQGRLEMRPIATKFSNLGFVIEESEKEFRFEVGEVDGEKSELVVSF